MCGRYNFSQEESDEIREIVREVERRQRGEFKMGEIYPTNVAPVLVAGDDRPVPELLAWGFPRFDKKGVVINARAETAPDKPMFRKCLEQRRCVIPSTGFYEWAADKTKYRFRLPGEDALYMAGLYNEFAGEPRYVILTTAANESIADVHNRMPVVLPRARIAEWIGGLGAALEILRAVPPMLERTAS